MLGSPPPLRAPVEVSRPPQQGATSSPSRAPRPGRLGEAGTSPTASSARGARDQPFVFPAACSCLREGPAGKGGSRRGCGCHAERSLLASRAGAREVARRHHRPGPQGRDSAGPRARVVSERAHSPAGPLAHAPAPLAPPPRAAGRATCIPTHPTCTLTHIHAPPARPGHLHAPPLPS